VHGDVAAVDLVEDVPVVRQPQPAACDRRPRLEPQVGAVEVPREEYLRRLCEAVRRDVTFG